MTKRIFVLNGHPAETSLNQSLAEAYALSASKAGHEVRIAHISDMEFDADRKCAGYGPAELDELEPDLAGTLQNLEWAQHIVLTTPMWWGGMPAKLKGLFDRALLPGHTFDTRQSTMMGFPKPMLSGRSARVIVTSDTPGWFMKLCYGNALFRQIRHQVLGFVGIAPTRITHLRITNQAKPKHIQSWIRSVETLGQNAA